METKGHILRLQLDGTRLELQRRCFHAGTHLNNSRINRREAAGSAATIEKLSDLIRVLHVSR